MLVINKTDTWIARVLDGAVQEKNKIGIIFTVTALVYVASAKRNKLFPRKRYRELTLDF